MTANKLDILAIGIHPDDVELGCGGTLLREIANGKKCGVLHLTKGEMGTRGTAEIRMKESLTAGKMMGVQVVEQLDLKDCLFENNEGSRKEIIQVIRKYRPRVVLCNTLSDRHPDHGRAGRLISDACYYSGLSKLKTDQDPYRPIAVYHYAQDRVLVPDLVVDITPYFQKKMEVIKCYSSQFFDPSSKEPATPISGKDFMAQIESKARVYGREIGVEYGEAFTTERALGITTFEGLL